MARIKATQVSDNYFVGVTTLADIRGNCPDPKRVDLSTEAQRRADKDLDRAWHKRGANQRQFNKARKDRAAAYGSYIYKVDNGELLGGYPPITLWTEDDAVYQDGYLEISGAAILSANDGETQLAARYMLANERPELLDQPFAVTITINSSKDDAMQTLHDMNHYATPVSEKETAALNVEGPLTKAINAGIEAAGIEPDAFIKARGEKVTKGYATTNTIILFGAVASLHGEAALHHSPNSLLKKDNSQFGDLNGKGEVASQFVSEVLRLPYDVLKDITSDHMMALGAKYNLTRKLSTPLPVDAYRELDERLRVVNKNGKRNRATLPVRARAIFDKLA